MKVSHTLYLLVGKTVRLILFFVILKKELFKLSLLADNPTPLKREMPLLLFMYFAVHTF